MIDSFNAIDDILANIKNEDSIFRFNVDEKKASELLKTFKEEKRSSHLYDKFKELFPDFKNSKDKTRIDELIKLICGRKFKLSPFETKEDSDDDNDKDTKTKDKSIEINDEFENKLLEANLDDDNYNLIIEAKKIYDTRILVNILKDGNSLSTYMVNIYNNHGEQLKELKNLIYKYNKSEYYKFFDKSEEKVKDKNGKETTIKNYYSYINNRADTKLDDLYKRINKILNITDDKGKERENIPEDIKKIKDSMDKQEFLLIQNSSNNGVLPYQLNENELRTILEKQGKYYSFLLNKDKDYLHPNRQEYKIVSLLKFKIPYYVGPISNRGDKDNKHWASKYNINEKLTPWNFDDIVDRKKSEENFIEKLTNNCTYILGEKTLPKNSLCIQMFNLLNFLNNIKIDNKYIDEETKNYLIDNLYLKYTKIDGKKFKECLKEKYKIDVNVTYASGLKEVEDNAYVNTLSSYVKFIDIYGEDFYKDEDLFNNVEEIIKLVTVLEDKDNLKDKLKSETKFKLDDKQIEKISNFGFKGWSTLCKKLLVDLKYEYIDNVTAEVKNYNVLDFLRHSFKDDNNQDINYNFSFIYNNEDSKSGLITDFKKQVNKLNDEYLNTHSMSENEIIDEAYISPMMKRAVKQTFKIINELLKYLHIEQFDRIFVECTREKQESKNSKSRKDLILEYYNAAKEFKDEVEECKKEIGKFSPDQLRSKKLFLYFMQLGKCVYTGEKIDLDDLLKSNSNYDIDHIIPQAKLKDDSFINTVLVEKNINNRKQDVYPLQRGTILTSEGEKWIRTLNKANSNLMPKDKMNRLLRTKPLTENELVGFVNRQLVSTNQSVKAVCDLIKEFKKVKNDNDLIYSKAGLVSEFRNIFKISKIRDLNDYHHAHDAYLNIVVGNVYYKKFTNNFSIRKLKEDFSKYNDGYKSLKTDPINIFRYNQNIKNTDNYYWLAPKLKKDENGNDIKDEFDLTETGIKGSTLEKVYKVIFDIRPLCTHMMYTQKGKSGFFNKISYLEKKDRKEFDQSKYLPLKSNLSFEKYGGYSDLTAPYFMLVKSKDKKGKKGYIYSLENIPSVYIAEYLNKDGKLIKEKVEEYLSKVKNLNDPEIILDKLLIRTVIEIPAKIKTVTGEEKISYSYDNTVKLGISGKFGDRILLINLSQLMVDKKYHEYLRKISKYLGTNLDTNAKKENQKKINTDKDDLENGKFEEKTGFTKEVNEEIFEYLITDILKKNCYSQLASFKTHIDKLMTQNAKLKFKELSIIDQLKCINSILNLVSCKSVQKTNLKMLDLKERCSLYINKKLNSGLRIISTSTTGLYKTILFTVPKDKE